MRRKRTYTDWIIYGLIAGVLLLLAGIICMGIELASVKVDNAALLHDREQETDTATGGLEIPVPAFVPQTTDMDLWQFPIAQEDYRVLTSPFGIRVSPLLHVEVVHQGVDIAAAWRSQVVAVADGTVVEHWPPPDGYYRGHDVYGGLVVLEHAGGTRSLYAHLSWSRVHTGQHVRAGEVIGRIGNTGRSYGEHLHFGIYSPDGDPLNPLLYCEVPR